VATFAELAQTFLTEEYAEAPVLASALGVPGHDDRLDDLSAAAFERRRDRAAAWHARFEALDDGALSAEARLDRGLLLSVLRGRLVMADWEMWRRQPDTYLGPGLTGVFTLLLHRLRPEPELAGAVAARLRAVPAALAEGRRNLQADLMPRVYVERALGQARAAERYARDLVAAEVADPAARARVADAGAVAADAFADFTAFLEGARAAARGTWAIGEARYTRLLQERELLADDARTLRERGRREYDRLAGELGDYARRIAGTDDWRAVLRDLRRDHPTTPEAMRAAYAAWAARARGFLRERGLVTLPAGEECVVAPSPPFQRPVLAVASYQSPPPFTPSLRGHFFVPYPPEGASADEVQQRLQNNSFAGIPTTAVHEAYPGHHWHLVVARAHPSAVRRTFRTPYFSEGWALYAEQMMREQGFFTDLRHAMSQVEAMLFRAARIVVDVSLHLGEMAFDDAVRFMQEQANLPEPTAVAEVRRYCSWPTQASAYLTGCLEILRIRQAYLARRGASGPDALRAFHDALAASGALPLGLAERAVLR
jgi:uncharacterized protein (DUF885 family)